MQAMRPRGGVGWGVNLEKEEVGQEVGSARRSLSGQEGVWVLEQQPRTTQHHFLDSCVPVGESPTGSRSSDQNRGLASLLVEGHGTSRDRLPHRPQSLL